MKRLRSWLFTGALVAGASASAQSYMIVLEGAGFPPVTLRECRNIGSSSEVIEHKILDPKGGEIIRKVPGQLTYFDIVCSRGLSSDLAISDWRKLVEDERIDLARKDMVMTLFDSSFTEVASWSLTGAWPSRLVVDVEGTVPLETLTIVTEGVVRTR